MSESHLQQSCVRWFRYAYPYYRILLFAIPNGGMRNRFEARILSRQGVVPGVCDLFLSVARQGYHGLYIELKYGKNTLTSNQEIFITYARAAGYKCEVVTSFDQFQALITSYLNPYPSNS